ncbi:MAG: glycosyltransferase family 2 protein, partial [Bacteroidota bacterium]
ATPKLGAVGACLLTPEGTEQRPSIPFWGRSKHRKGQPVPIGWLPGACLLLKREALDRIGWLDEGFFFYNEDLDLGLRLRKAGFRLRYLPAAQVVHHEGKSSDLVRPMAILEGYRGGLRLTAKHYGSLALAGARWGMKLERFWRDANIERKQKRGLPLTGKETAWQTISQEVGTLLREYRYNG